MTRIGRQVDELDLVGGVDDPVGHGLADADAGDLEDGVVQAFQVLDVDGGDDVDAGVAQLFDALPALLVLGARDVRVRQLIDEDPFRPSLEDGIGVELVEGLAAILDGLERDLLEPLHQLRGRRPPVRLDEADDDVFAARAAPVGLGEHAICLADARHGAEEDLQLAARSGLALGRQQLFFGHCDCPLCAASSARFNSSTLTRFSPRKPRSRPAVFSSTRRLTSSSLMPRAAATRAICASAFAGEMSGSRPLPEAVTMSTGTFAGSSPGFSARTCATAERILFDQSSTRRAEVRGAGGHRVVAVAGGGRPRMEVLRAR